MRQAAKEADQDVGESQDTMVNDTSCFSELDRTISVRWRPKGESAKIDGLELRKLFERFGNIQECVVTKAGEKKKLRNGLIVFESIVGAHAAVRGALVGIDGDFKHFKTVTWASGKEPNLTSLPAGARISPPTPGAVSSSPSPASKSPSPIAKATWAPPIVTPKGKLKKVPSFASFSSSSGTTINSPFSKTAVAQSPDYENITLMRMRDAEKRRLEAEIRKKDVEGSND